MKILLSGVETNNKGAELMFYAILQEIERKAPNAEVYISRNRIKQGLNYVKTGVNLKLIPCEDLEDKLHLTSLFARLKLPFKLLPHFLTMGEIDYYIDSSGFRYSDQFNFTHSMVNVFRNQLITYKKQGAKIIFLPQAFGPFKKKVTKDVLSILMQYATIVMPREEVSKKYVEELGYDKSEKLKIFPDFTSLVEGIFPERYEKLRNGICVIPNKQMINKGAISLEKYLELLENIITISKQSGRIVYLLNHEGRKDEQLCQDLQKALPEKVEYVSGINALEVKGLISSAYLVISSRFHGVASALNTRVPCLATSWSHKYKELFNDYKMNDCILPLDNTTKATSMITEYLNEVKNQNIRSVLSHQTSVLQKEAREMWNTIWGL